MKEMHGEFPFPEATATTEVLVAGEAGGQQAKVLVAGRRCRRDLRLPDHPPRGLRGGLHDALGPGSSTASPSRSKLVFKLDVLASVMGLGYIIGLKYSAIICAGSFLSWFLLVPLVAHFGAGATTSPSRR